MTESTLMRQAEAVAVSADQMERLADAEPAWLAARRRDAWELHEATPMPNTRLEEWRYTNLKKLLDLDALVPAPQERVPDDPAAWPVRLRETMAEDREAAGHLVIIDGHVVHSDLDPALQAKGVVLSSLHDALEDHGELLERVLATKAVPADRSKFAALNAALWSDGVFLHVPRGVTLDAPIRVTRWLSHSGAAYFARALIVAETQSAVSYVDEIVSDDFERQSFLSSAVEVFAEDGARVQYASLQRLGHNGFYQSEQRTLAKRDSQLDTLNVSLGGSVTRVDLNATLLGPGARSEMLGLYFGDAEQHFDHNTSQDHQAPNTFSDLLYKGALDGSSRSVFRGIIRVAPQAQQTDAYQTNRNLVLSEHARADSLPNLEIQADDVKCSHGATVGQLDAEELFYLQSRGLSLERAERLAVTGFLGDVLSRLPLGGVVEKVTRAIEEKLNA